MVESKNKEFGYFKLLDEMASGMTFRNFGNFAEDEFNEKYSAIAKEVGINDAPPLITMLANKHTDRVLYFKKVEVHKSIYDGIIYKGNGAAVFFPGGCLPIAFRDMENNLSGLLHVSIQTMSQDIISVFLKKWKLAGGNPSRTRIFFLPAICGDCLDYEAKYFQEKIFPKVKPLMDLINASPADRSFIRYNKGFFYLNLIKLANELVKIQGYDLISLSNECTCCNHNRYWCYRHNDNDYKKFRNAAFIITPEIEPPLPFQR